MRPKEQAERGLAHRKAFVSQKTVMTLTRLVKSEQRQV
jgi:hypothetical protein